MPPREEVWKAFERLYRASTGEHGPRHNFPVVTDYKAELCDRTVALVADAVQCQAPHSMILPRQG